jgi:DNA polymerase III subunit chi
VTSIDFYFNAPDRVEVACRLAAKAFAQRKRLLIYAPQHELAQRLDKLLWTQPAIGFLPHCAAHDRLAPQTPLLIAQDEASPGGCGVLLNLSEDCPPHFERFERLLEVVAADEAQRQAGRGRYRFYRDRGYSIATHDLATASDG